MAQYKGKNGFWYIQARNQITKKGTTIRINPKTNMPFKTKKEAKDYENYYIKNKIDLSIKFDDLISRYLDDYLSLRPSSSEREIRSWYKNNIQNIIGNKKIASLKIQDIEKIVKNMSDKGLSPRYINKNVSIIKTVLNYGVSHGYIEKNPIIAIKPLKVVTNSEDIKFWMPNEFQKAIDCIPIRFGSNKTDHELIKLVISFGYFTGLRKGEIRALKWKNIDMSRGVIHIDYHVYDKTNKAVKGRKNGNGYTIVIDKRTKKVLDKAKKHYENVEGFSNEAYVFPSLKKGFNEPIGEHTMSRWMKEIAEYSQVPHITFHGLSYPNFFKIQTC